MIVAARIPEELKIRIDDLCEKEGKTVSDLIRNLLEEYVKIREEEWQRVRVNVRIPKKILSQIDMFIDRGYALDREHVINESLTLWLKIKKFEYRRGWKEELMEALDESSRIV